MAIQKTNTRTTITGDVEFSRTNNTKVEKALFSYQWNGEAKKANFISNGKVIIDGTQVATFNYDINGKKTIYTAHDVSEVGDIIDTAIAEFNASF